MIRQGKYTKKVSPIRRMRRHGRRHWRWFKRLSRPKKVLLIAAPFIAFLVLTPLLTYAYYAHDISNQERLMNRNNTGIVLMDRHGKVFYDTGRAEHREIVPLDQIAPITRKALLASEDKDFYKHGGFSIASIFKALYADITTGDATAYGGSTLTQQLAKNTLLTNNQTYLRKYQELAVAIAIEHEYSKDQILDMYLNSVFFGGTTFGIEDAAKDFFNTTPDKLDLAQSAMIIGVLPAPNAYSPIVGNMTYAKERQNTVLTRMVKDGFITESDKQAALAEQLHFAAPKNINDSQAPAFAQMVLSQLNSKYGEEKVARSGYQVTTTLDLTLQRQVEKNIANHLPYIQANGGSNVSAVAIDPKSGEIRALVGSADWNNPKWGKVNMATTPRQPGSSFKPIYYSQALASGVITPATILHDVPTDFDGYKPLDADRQFRGDVTVRSAISQSLNIPSVEVMQKFGIKQAITGARRLGITTLDPNKNYGLSLALGSAEVPLTEMTNAYAALADGGQRHPITFIKQVEDKFDKTIFTAAETSKTAISPEGAFLMSNILSDNNARAPIFGSSLTVWGHRVAVKTGTTDDNRDAWTIGYTPQLAMGFWVGNNDNTPMLDGGSDMAGPIWVNTMQQALAGLPDVGFTQPSDVVVRPVCYGNGGLAPSSGYGTYNEYFLSWALPETTCAQPKPPKKPPVKKEKDKSTEQKKDTDTSSGDNGAGDGTGGGTTTPPTDDGTGDTPPSTGGDGGTTPPTDDGSPLP